MSDLGTWIAAIMFAAFCGLGWLALVIVTERPNPTDQESEPHIWPLDGAP